MGRKSRGKRSHDGQRDVDVMDAVEDALANMCQEGAITTPNSAPVSITAVQKGIDIDVKVMPPWDFDSIGITLADPVGNGCRLDHIKRGGPASSCEGLRIGLACTRVNRFATEGRRMEEIRRIIHQTESSAQPLFLRFRAEAFVLNPAAGKITSATLAARESAAAAFVDGAATQSTFDVESGAETQPGAHERLRQCPEWDALCEWARVHFMVELVGLALFPVVQNYGVVGTIAGAGASGCIQLDTKISTSGLAIFDNDINFMVAIYSKLAITALLVGLVAQSYYLLGGYPPTPWWCDIDMGGGSGVQTLDDEEFMTCNISVLRGIVFLQSCVETVIRWKSWRSARRHSTKIEVWLQTEADYVEAAVLRVQRIWRGILCRQDIMQKHGIVTRAIAGTHWRAEYYTPDSTIAARVQHILQIWHGSRRPQTLHKMRSQASSIHRCMEEISGLYTRADKNGDGNLQLSEVSDLVKAMGIRLSEVACEFLFYETFAPVVQDSSKSAMGVSATEIKQRKKRRTDPLSKSNAASTGESSSSANNTDGDKRQFWPKVGDRVQLTAAAIYENQGNELLEKVLGPEDIGLVVTIDEASLLQSHKVQYPIDTLPGMQANTSWYRANALTLEGSRDPVADEQIVAELLQKTEVKLLRDSYHRMYSSTVTGGLSYDATLAFLASAYVLRLFSPEKDVRPNAAKFVKSLLAAFDVAIDCFMYLDAHGHGVLILSEISETDLLKSLKITDLVSMGRLKKLGRAQPDHICLLTFLPSFLHWIDGSLDDV